MKQSGVSVYINSSNFLGRAKQAVLSIRRRDGNRIESYHFFQIIAPKIASKGTTLSQSNVAELEATIFYRIALRNGKV